MGPNRNCGQDCPEPALTGQTFTNVLNSLMQTLITMGYKIDEIHSKLYGQTPTDCVGITPEPNGLRDTLLYAHDLVEHLERDLINICERL